MVGPRDSALEHMLQCSQCDGLNPPEMSFCGRCAAPLSSEVARRYGEDEAERRQLTVLFCDIVESTRHASSMDPEEWRAVLRAYHQLCDEIITPMRGHVAQILGDGLLVYFGYPVALEDAPRRAVLAGLALVRNLPAAAIRIKLPRRTPRSVVINVRVGIHTGEVVVDRFGGSNPQPLAVGDTLNVAFRIQSDAQSNTVVISSVTQQLTAGFFTTRALGARMLAGFEQPWRLYEVHSETSARNRLEVAAASTGLTPFVNRKAEMKVLHALWQRAAGSGEQRPVVLISGDAGVGKSRHVQMLRRRLEGELAGFVECQCSTYFQNTALYPLLEVIERHAELDRNESPEQSHARLERLLGEKREVTREDVALIASLLSLPLARGYPVPDLPPQRLRQQAFELIARFIDDQRPALWIVEDLHWADPSTLDFLGFYLERGACAGVLPVLTHRPEFRCAWQSPRLVHLVIDRLPRAETEAVVKLVAGERQLPSGLMPELLSKADGNPLFAEEVTKAVLEDPLQHHHHHYSADGDRKSDPLSEIPASVRDPLMARVDGLGASKPLAQLAATFGRELSFRLLCRVADASADDVRADLQRLVDAGLIFPLHGTGEETYVWKHALIRDAAYQSLLESSRQRHHQRIARVMMDEFPEIAERKPELLAQHFEQAGEVPEAIRLWSVVGQRANTRSGFAEAVVAFTRALEQLLWLPEDDQRDHVEIELRAGLGLALLSSEGFSSPAVAANAARARDLCARYGDVPLSVLYGMWVYQIVRGDPPAVTRIADIFAERLARGCNASEELLLCSCLTVRSFWMGRFRHARDYALRAQQIVDGWDDPSAQNAELMRHYSYEGPLYPLGNLAWCELYDGKLAACRSALAQGLALAERIDQPYVTAMIHAYAAAITHDMRDAKASLEHAERTVAIASEHQYPFWLAVGLFASGAALCELGDEEKGLATIERGRGLYKEMGVLSTSSYFTSYLVERYLAAGRVSEGLALTQELLELSASNVGCGYMPELLRLRGELLVRKGDVAEGCESLKQALAAAQAQGTALFELRSALSLMRAGGGEVARAALERACEAFDVDADLSELLAARQLLSE
mgnify:CR=1 FL=1